VAGWRKYSILDLCVPQGLALTMSTDHNTRVAQSRLQGMRGQGFFGAALHSLGVRLGLNYGGSFFYPSEDRSVLESLIIPYFQLSAEHNVIWFIGTDWYTQGYNRMFARKTFATMDADPKRSRYGSERHIVDSVLNLDRHAEANSIDVIFLNGVVGWGLNSREDAEKTFGACHRCLRSGGHLLIGWNDLPEHRPFRLEEIQALSGFERWLFPPLNTTDHLIANEWRHVFSFFRKKPTT
jgi:SAM-dependent methyltransferase